MMAMTKEKLENQNHLPTHSSCISYILYVTNHKRGEAQRNVTYI